MPDGKKVSASRLSSGKTLDGPGETTGIETREVGLSSFCFDAATRLGAGQGAAPAVAAAVYLYLDPDSERRFGWPLADFQRTAAPAASVAQVEVGLELRDWARLEAEAARQGVSEQQLIRHAVTFAAAQRDRGV